MFTMDTTKIPIGNTQLITSCLLWNRQRIKLDTILILETLGMIHNWVPYPPATQRKRTLMSDDFLSGMDCITRIHGELTN